MKTIIEDLVSAALVALAILSILLPLWVIL